MRTVTHSADNGKLRDKLRNGEIFYSLKEVKVLLEMCREHYNCPSYCVTGLCACRRKGWVIDVKSRALVAAVATDSEPDRRVGQVGAAEHPGADRQRMESRDLVTFSRQPQRLGARPSAAPLSLTGFVPLYNSKAGIHLLTRPVESQDIPCVGTRQHVD